MIDPILTNAIPPQNTLGIRMEKTLNPNNLPHAANWSK